MTKTKKRAAKRAAAKPIPTKFKWPYRLCLRTKIANLKAYREYHNCSLYIAKSEIEKAMGIGPSPQVCNF